MTLSLLEPIDIAPPFSILLKVKEECQNKSEAHHLCHLYTFTLAAFKDAIMYSAVTRISINRHCSTGR
jgi:hypothetical protein